MFVGRGKFKHRRTCSNRRSRAKKTITNPQFRLATTAGGVPFIVTGNWVSKQAPSETPPKKRGGSFSAKEKKDLRFPRMSLLLFLLLSHAARRRGRRKRGCKSSRFVSISMCREEKAPILGHGTKRAQKGRLSKTFEGRHYGRTAFGDGRTAGTHNLRIPNSANLAPRAIFQGEAK